jgi:hypothetical protein
LFLSPDMAASEMVIRHELVHIRQKHSWDIIYLELMKIINWFNPMAYLLQHSMKELHEFIADDSVAGSKHEADIYIDFLLANAYGAYEHKLTNNLFNQSLLKKRIMMLHQKRSGNTARLKYLLVLPLAGCLLCASTLAFAKDYGWIDIAPRTISGNSLTSGKSLKTKLLKITQGGMSLITEKLTIHEKSGRVLNYTGNTLTAKDKEFLLKKHKVTVDIYETEHPEKYQGIGGMDIYISDAGKTSPQIRKTDTAIRGKIDKTINQQIDSVVNKNNKKIKGEIKSQVGQQIQQHSHKLPPPSGMADGFEDLNSYLSKNVAFPQNAQAKKSVGNVIVQFTVGSEHKIADIKVLTGASDDFNNEVIRSLKAYAGAVNKEAGNYVLAFQFSIIHTKIQDTDLPPPISNDLLAKPNCAGLIQVVTYLAD